MENKIEEIKVWHRRRCFAMEQRKRSDLALASWLRTQLGWRRDLPDKERAAINKRALDLIACGEKTEAGKSHPLAQERDYIDLSPVIGASLMARSAFDGIEDDAEKEMASLAKSLPVWNEFGERVRGFGPKSLAVIIGEAGDLSSYDSEAKLWKRMGLAVMGGVRQGGLPKNAGADEWIAHGYNRKRRSHIWNIGDALVKQGEYYRAVYLARKEYERERAVANGLKVAPSAQIPKKKAHEYISDGHIHRRAQRYMEKRLLKDLWQAWRRANVDAP